MFFQGNNFNICWAQARVLGAGCWVLGAVPGSVPLSLHDDQDGEGALRL